MKISLLKTNKQNKQSVKLLTFDELMNQMGHDTYYGDVEALRSFVRWADPTSQYNHIDRLPVISPAAELTIRQDGTLQMRHFNGLVTLSIGPVSNDREVARIKQAVSMLPMTVAALQGSSGHTVKVIVAVSREGDALPQTQQEAERLCQQAYPLLCPLYQVVIDRCCGSQDIQVLQAQQHQQSNLLLTGFRMTLDSEPYYRADAQPFRVDELLSQPAASPVMTPEAVDMLPDSSSAISTATQQLITLLTTRYDFRYNRMMGYAEYRSKKASYYGWQPVDEKMLNSLSMEARLAGLNVWDKDVKRFLKSNMVKPYDPVVDYLLALRGKWDGRDHIGQLASTVPTRQQHWQQWFRTWLLAMVAQWLHRNPRYGNALAPLLISRQGYNKSTFCRSLIPPELQWGYNDNLVLAEKKSVLQAMSQFLLINLDEFNQISPKVQEGFLKNLIQLASVKVKPPYGKHVEEFPRMASFIATANVTDILADPSGNRRFMGIELTGPIDVSRPVNHHQLYAQALTLLEQGEPYWMDDSQTQAVIASNRQFQLRSVEEIYFNECFRLPIVSKDGQWFSAASIYEQIRQQVGSTALRSGNVIRFSRMLSNISGVNKRHTRNGTEYLVERI